MILKMLNKVYKSTNHLLKKTLDFKNYNGPRI